MRRKEEKTSPLPALQEGEVTELKKFEPQQHFTQPPAHYTDATLIRAMEEQGIGRPSTYAPTVSTILDREYVVKRENTAHYRPGPCGDCADAGTLSRYRRYEFTANMEEKLDGGKREKTRWKRAFCVIFTGILKRISPRRKGAGGPH